MRRRRAARTAGLVLLAAAVLWEIGINTLLMSGALSRVLSADPATLLIEYASGWMLLPGRVHARGLRIRSRDSNVDFQLTIERCVFDVSLLDLARRRFHVTRVDGEGVAFRARRRLEPEDATEKTVAALPPIDGFERVPLKPYWSGPPPDDAHYRLWTVELDRVDARDTREVWVDELHLTGKARVLGGFYLRPVRWAAVGKGVVQLEEGRLAAADEPIADPLRGTLSVAIEGFDPRSTDGAGILRRTTAEIAMDGELPRARVVDRWLTGHGPRVRGGSGNASVVLRLDHGRLAAPTRTTIDLRGVTLDADEAWGEGNLHATASVIAPAPGDGGGEAELDASLEARDLRAGTRGVQGPALRVPRADVRLRSAHLDLTDRPFSDPSLTARLPSLDIVDARAANAWLGPDRIAAGHGGASGELSVAHGLAHGEAALDLDGLRLDLPAAQLSGDVRARVNLAEWDLNEGTIDAGGSRLDLREVTSGDTHGWWAHADFPSSTLRVRQGISWRTHVEVRARDARPLIAIAVPDGLPRWAAGLSSTDGLRASMDVRVAKEAIALDRVAVTAGPFAVAGRYARRGASDEALFLVEAGPLALGVEKEGEATHLQLLDPRGWFRQRSVTAADARGTPGR